MLETDEEMQEEQEEANPFDMSPGMIPISNALVMQELREYRNATRHFHMHYQGSVFCTDLPFDVDLYMWYEYYRMLERFTNLFPHKIMHVQGRITVPWEVTTAVRNVVYRMFLYNNPFSVFTITRSVWFRLSLVQDGRLTDFQVDIFLYCLMEVDLHFNWTYCWFDYFLVDYHCQKALYSLHRFRDVGRPFEMHNSLTASWPALSYPILQVTGFTYCHMLDDFVPSADSERQPLYIHSTVTLPFSVVSSQTVCSMIYRMFSFNTPYVVFTEFCSINQV